MEDLVLCNMKAQPLLLLYVMAKVKVFVHAIEANRDTRDIALPLPRFTKNYIFMVCTSKQKEICRF